jgi:hypothetical protein
VAVVAFVIAAAVRFAGRHELRGSSRKELR